MSSAELGSLSDGYLPRREGKREREERSKGGKEGERGKEQGGVKRESRRENSSERWGVEKETNKQKQTGENEKQTRKHNSKTNETFHIHSNPFYRECRHFPPSLSVSAEPK